MVTIPQLINERTELRTRMQEIADRCEREQRERNEAEDRDYRDARTRMQQIDMQMDTRNSQTVSASRADSFVEFRDRLLSGGHEPVKAVITRDASYVTTSVASPSATPTGLIPVSQQEFLKPLRPNNIWNLVGLDIRTGNAGNELRWPIHGKATAAFRTEGAAATASIINFSKLSVKPEPLSVRVPVTREALEQSAGVVEEVVLEEMPNAVIDLINADLFAVTTSGHPCAGPFAATDAQNVAFAAAEPTRAELLSILYKVKSGIGRIRNGGWVLNPVDAQVLANLKVDAGSGRFVYEDGKILGYPVFESGDVEAGYICFGDWSWQAAGFFGPMSVTADPYTLLANNAVDFVLHTSWATVTLRKEAFAYGKYTKPA